VFLPAPELTQNASRVVDLVYERLNINDGFLSAASKEWFNLLSLLNGTQSADNGTQPEDNGLNRSLVPPIDPCIIVTDTGPIMVPTDIPDPALDTSIRTNILSLVVVFKHHNQVSSASIGTPPRLNGVNAYYERFKLRGKKNYDLVGSLFVLTVEGVRVTDIDSTIGS